MHAEPHVLQAQHTLFHRIFTQAFCILRMECIFYASKHSIASIFSIQANQRLIRLFSIFFVLLELKFFSESYLNSWQPKTLKPLMKLFNLSWWLLHNTYIIYNNLHICAKIRFFYWFPSPFHLSFCLDWFWLTFVLGRIVFDMPLLESWNQPSRLDVFRFFDVMWNLEVLKDLLKRNIEATWT